MNIKDYEIYIVGPVNFPFVLVFFFNFMTKRISEASEVEKMAASGENSTDSVRLH